MFRSLEDRPRATRDEISVGGSLGGWRNDLKVRLVDCLWCIGEPNVLLMDIR